MKHLGLHLQLSPEEAKALDAAVKAEQKRVGESARVTVSSYILGLIRKALKKR